MSTRSTLAVLVMLVCGCEPMSGSPGLLEPHRGEVSQSALDGPLFSAEVRTVSPPEEVEELVEADEGAPSPSPETETAPVPVLPDEDLGTPSAVSSPVVEDLPDELRSGEYGSGAIVTQQQASLPPDALGQAVPESVQGAAGMEVSASDDGAGPASAPGSMPQSDRSFAPLPQGGPAASGNIDVSAVLPAGPTSDQDAIDAFGALPRRSVATLGGASSPCIPAQSGLLSIPVSQLSMVRAWLDGTLLRAELRGPGGRLYTVVRGDRVGSEGGRVLQLSSTEVVVGEIGFGLDGSPFIVQEAIRVRP